MVAPVVQSQAWKNRTCPYCGQRSMTIQARNEHIQEVHPGNQIPQIQTSTPYYKPKTAGVADPLAELHRSLGNSGKLKPTDRRLKINRDREAAAEAAQEVVYDLVEKVEPFSNAPIVSTAFGRSGNYTELHEPDMLIMQQHTNGDGKTTLTIFATDGSIKFKATGVGKMVMLAEHA